MIDPQATTSSYTMVDCPTNIGVFMAHCQSVRDGKSLQDSTESIFESEKLANKICAKNAQNRAKNAHFLRVKK